MKDLTPQIAALMLQRTNKALDELRAVFADAAATNSPNVHTASHAAYQAVAALRDVLEERS